MDNDTLVDLVRKIEGIGVKLDTVISNYRSLEERIAKQEALREQAIKQDEKIGQMLDRLQQGNEHFNSIDARLRVLEMQEGDRAAKFVSQVRWLFVAAVVGGVIGNIGGIIHWMGTH